MKLYILNPKETQIFSANKFEATITFMNKKLGINIRRFIDGDNIKRISIEIFLIWKRLVVVFNNNYLTKNNCVKLKDSDILINDKTLKEVRNDAEIILNTVVKKKRKRNPILENILNDAKAEPWYDKVRWNLNIMLYYKIWINPFCGVFGK